MPEIGRVRSLYLDFNYEASDRWPHPHRGDRVSSGKSLYYVLTARRVKRRDPSSTIVRIQMRVIKREDMPERLSGRLIQSAIRGHGGSFLFEFQWYPRKRKARSFEQYMGAR